MNEIKGNGAEKHAGDFAMHDRAQSLLFKCVDSLNAGQKLDLDQIQREHPDIGPEVVRQLKAFEGIPDDDGSHPLGTLGDYTLRRQIGRGGMGVVYEAWQNSMNRPVALKVLPVGVAADRKACARFLREAQTTGQLKHPNVVHVHGLGIEQNTPYYAMEYVEGETLAQILAKLRAAKGNEEQKTVILQSLSHTLQKRADTNLADGEGAEGELDDKPVGEGIAAADSQTDKLGYYCNLADAFTGVCAGLQHAHSKDYTSYYTSFAF